MIESNQHIGLQCSPLIRLRPGYRFYVAQHGRSDGIYLTIQSPIPNCSSQLFGFPTNEGVCFVIRENNPLRSTIPCSNQCLDFHKHDKPHRSMCSQHQHKLRRCYHSMNVTITGRRRTRSASAASVNTKQFTADQLICAYQSPELSIHFNQEHVYLIVCQNEFCYTIVIQAPGVVSRCHFVPGSKSLCTSYILVTVEPPVSVYKMDLQELLDVKSKGAKSYATWQTLSNMQPEIDLYSVSGRHFIGNYNRKTCIYQLYSSDHLAYPAYVYRLPGRVKLCALTEHVIALVTDQHFSIVMRHYAHSNGTYRFREFSYLGSVILENQVDGDALQLIPMVSPAEGSELWTISQTAYSISQNTDLNTSQTGHSCFQTSVHMESILLARINHNTLWCDNLGLEDRLLYHVGVLREENRSFSTAPSVCPNQYSTQLPRWFLITEKTIYLIYPNLTFDDWILRLLLDKCYERAWCVSVGLHLDSTQLFMKFAAQTIREQCRLVRQSDQTCVANCESICSCLRSTHSLHADDAWKHVIHCFQTGCVPKFMQVLALTTGRPEVESSHNIDQSNQTFPSLMSTWPGKRMILAVGLRDNLPGNYNPSSSYHGEEITSNERLDIFKLHMFAKILSDTKRHSNSSTPWHTIQSLGYKKQFLEFLMEEIAVPPSTAINILLNEQALDEAIFVAMAYEETEILIKTLANRHWTIMNYSPEHVLEHIGRFLFGAIIAHGRASKRKIKLNRTRFLRQACELCHSLVTLSPELFQNPWKLLGKLSPQSLRYLLIGFQAVLQIGLGSYYGEHWIPKWSSYYWLLSSGFVTSQKTVRSNFQTVSRQKRIKIPSRTLLTSSAYDVDKMKQAFLLLVCLLDHSVRETRGWDPTLGARILYPSLWLSKVAPVTSENLNELDLCVFHPKVGLGSCATSPVVTELIAPTASNATETPLESDMLQIFLDALFQPTPCVCCAQVDIGTKISSFYGLKVAVLEQTNGERIQNSDQVQSDATIRIWRCGQYRQEDENKQEAVSNSSTDANISDHQPFQCLKQCRTIEVRNHIIVSVAVGLQHLLALTEKGLILTWNEKDQNEDGHSLCSIANCAPGRSIYSNRRDSHLVPLPVEVQAKHISTRFNLSGCISHSGSVWYWNCHTSGVNRNSKTQNEMFLFASVSSQTFLLDTSEMLLQGHFPIKIDCGLAHILLLTDSGQVWQADLISSFYPGMPDRFCEHSPSYRDWPSLKSKPLNRLRKVPLVGRVQSVAALDGISLCLIREAPFENHLTPNVQTDYHVKIFAWGRSDHLLFTIWFGAIGELELAPKILHGALDLVRQVGHPPLRHFTFHFIFEYFSS
ncbi:hypothetical protein D915_007490 [Fasciola hepatica]|uniref:Uncharacterized protein n=1 Tax=Fasciola hepatica TaxID=6192 RepID=A0A4E0RJL1_FASHE|nr:hypothetical protein D915_007490 [Fasciola hepatica]